MLNTVKQEINGDGNNQALGDINIYLNKEISYKLLEYVPNIDDDYIEREYTNNLLDVLKNDNIIQIYGISGIGKSELVKSVISKIQQKENIYWISCNDKNKEVDLAGIINIYGKCINILDKIKKEKIIIIIDNYNNELKDICKEFNNNNRTNSKLVVTSKEKSTYKHLYSFFVDYMSYDEAKKMFPSEILEAEEFSSFLEKIDRHPMTLQILKNYVSPENGITFNDIKEELNNLVNMDDAEISSSLKICEKIIGMYYKNNPKLYKFLSICDNNILEIGFLKKVMMSEIPGLVRKCFIKCEKEFYYMHSIIKDSIKAIVKKEGYEVSELKEYTDELLKYLEIKIEIKDLSFYRFYGYNFNLLENLYDIIDDNYYKIVIYNAYIAVSNYHNKSDVISDIEKLIENSQIDKYFELKLLIEKYELEVTCTDREHREQVILEKIKQLKSIECEHRDDKYKEFLQQRIAKFYNWSNNYDKAITILEDIVDKDKEAYSSILQLCRAYRQLALKNSNNVKEYIDKVCNVFKLVNFNKMPISIFLEILRLVIYRPFNKEEILDVCLWDNFDLFDECIKLYYENKVHEHIYIIIGSLASNLYYSKSVYYKEWFKKIEHPRLEECDKYMLKAMINIYCYEVKRRVQANENLEEILDLSEKYWRIYKENNQNLKKFEYKAIMDCLISVKKYDEANVELNEVYDENDIWHLRYKAQIEEGHKEYEKALQYIDLVISRYEGKQNHHEGYLDAFFEDKKRILKEKSKL